MFWLSEFELKITTNVQIIIFLFIFSVQIKQMKVAIKKNHPCNTKQDLPLLQEKRMQVKYGIIGFAYLKAFLAYYNIFGRNDNCLFGCLYKKDTISFLNIREKY